MKFKRCSLAILCGGKSSRMGGLFKGNLKINGKTFLETILNSIEYVFEDILFVGLDKNTFLTYFNYGGKRNVDDIYHSKGPLAGIHSALRNCVFDNVFIHSCDMPFIAVDKIEYLLSVHEEFENEISIPFVRQRFNPLCGIYSKFTADRIESLLINNSLRVSGIFKITKTMMIYSEDNLAFKNINNPGNYEEIKKIPFSQRGQE